MEGERHRACLRRARFIARGLEPIMNDATRWMQAWRSAGEALEGVRREELRSLDGRKTLALLTGPADYRTEPRKARPSSGLVEQQRWFKKARGDA
jgi:hypothetical protein